jgi:uncharacterized protein YbbK (DUF523 family)
MDVFRHGQRLPRVADFKSPDFVLVSACLAGMATRYDGTDAYNAELMGKLAGVNWVPVCPEELGGLPTPRPPADLVGGDGHDVLRGKARVMTADGRDVTAAFVEGAQAVLEVARRLKVRACYLKGRSPSCGLNPSRAAAGHMRGIGVCAALLIESGFKVIEVD